MVSQLPFWAAYTNKGSRVSVSCFASHIESAPGFRSQPLLFLIYFKDIPEVTQATSALLADDTLLYRVDCVGENQDSACCRLQQDILLFSIGHHQ